MADRFAAPRLVDSEEPTTPSTPGQILTPRRQTDELRLPRQAPTLSAGALNAPIIVEPPKLKPPSLEALPPGDGAPFVQSIEQAQQLRIWPSFDDLMQDIADGAGIVKDQVAQIIVETAEISERIAARVEREIPGISQFGIIRPVNLLGSVIADVTGDEPQERVRELAAFNAELERRIREKIGDPSSSVVGGVVRDLVRMALWSPILIFTRGLGGPTAQTIIGGTLIGQATFEAYEDRLSDLLTQIDNPIVNNAVTQALSADPDDKDWELKLKRVLEDTLLGVTTIGALKLGGVVASGAGRKTAELARNVFNTTAAVKRAKSASKVGVTPVTEAFKTSFRAGTEAADVEVARFADQLLKRPLPDGVSFDAYKASLSQQFREHIQAVSSAHGRKLTDEARTTVTIKPFTTRDINRKVELFQRRLDAAEVPEGTSVERVSQIRTIFDENDTALERAQSFNLKQTLQAGRRQFREKIIDRQGTVKRELLAQAGAEGKRAKGVLELAQGASPIAQRAFTAARRRIFENIPRQLKPALADLIRQRRIREIKTYNPDWEPPVVSKGTKTTVADYDGLVDGIRREVGEENYTLISAAADRYFMEMTKGLDALRASGVIGADEYARLWRFQWSPIEFFKEADPTIASFKSGGRVISIRSSGIKALDEGHRELMMNDPEFFLGQFLTRTYGRSFRNNANIGLYNVARTHPENNIVRLRKPKEGEWVSIGVRINGKQKKMFLRKDLVLGWNADPISVPAWIRNASLSPITRSFATGIFAPQFALVNLAYSTVYAMLTAGSGKLYSSFIPKTVLQLGGDMATVAKDTFTRDGLYNEFIERGGMMSLLTHQGRISPLDIRPTSQVRDALQAMERTLGYFTESTELWVRLAVMNRVLRRERRVRGFNTDEDMGQAVLEARNLIDFGQGGSWSKQIDQVIPYFNAGIQGFRGAARAVRDAPAETAFRAAQVGGLFSGVWYANHIANPEAFASIPTYIKDSNFVITTPLYRIDRDGNRRYMYFKIPLDHITRPLKALVDATMERVFTGKFPSDTTMRIMAQGATILPGVQSFPPSLNSVLALGANFDFWRGEEIWRGAKSISPTYEREVTGEDPTSNLAIDIAEGINPIFDQLGASSLRVSPERLEVATRAVIPEGPFTAIVGQGYKALTEKLPEETRVAHSTSIQQVLANQPFTRRFVGETHPFVRDTERLEQLIQSSSDTNFVLKEELRRQIDLFKAQGDFSVRQAKLVERWIAQQDPIQQPGLERYLKDLLKMDQIFDRFNPDSVPGSPSRSWWIVLGSAPPAARAAGLFEEWKDTQIGLESDDPEIRREASKRKQLVLSLMRNVPGFDTRRSKEFGMELGRLMREWNESIER